MTLAALGAALLLSACGGDVARAVGTENGKTVYQVYGKSPVANSQSPRDVFYDPVEMVERRNAIAAMARETCPDGYTTLGEPEAVSSYWNHGPGTQRFNGELRENQRIVCD